MAFDSLNGNINTNIGWNVTKNGPSASYTPVASAGTLQNNQRYVLGTGAGAINQIYSNIVTISSAGSVTLDLTVLTNVLYQSFGFTALKGYSFELLSAAEDSTNGTAASSITVGAAASNANLLDLAGTTPTFTVKNGGLHASRDASAGGLAVVDGTHKSIKILNNDGALAAAVRVSFFGLGS